MPSHPSSGGPRRLVLAAALLGALACLAAPAQAAPPPESAAVGPLAGVVAWLHDLLGDLGWEPAAPDSAPGEPGAAFLPEGQCVDPDGSTVPCSDGSGTSSSTLDLEKPKPGE